MHIPRLAPSAEITSPYISLFYFLCFRSTVPSVVTFHVSKFGNGLIINYNVGEVNVHGV